MLDSMQNRPGSTLLQPASSTPQSAPSTKTTAKPATNTATSTTATSTATSTTATTQSSTTTSSQSSVSDAADSKTVFPEANIRKIINNGFTKSEAIEELERFSGDTDQALASLFDKAIKF